MGNSFSLWQKIKQNQTLHGVFWMAVSSFLYVAQEAIVKMLTTELKPIDIVFFRNTFGLVFMLPLVFKHGIMSLRVTNKKLLMLRAVFGLGAMLTYTYALKYETFLTVGTISLLVPVLAAILVPLFLPERSNLLSSIALVVAFIGATLVVQSQGQGAVFNWSYGTLFAFASVAFNAGIFVIIKLLTKTESNISISVWLCLTQLVIAFPFVLSDWKWLDWPTLGLLAVIGSLTALAQMAFAQALRSDQIQSVIPSSFFRLVWILLIGVFFFKESFYLLSMFGAVLILIANLSIVFRSSKQTSH
ncbi:DMT family transporter [Sphingobacterium sp. lm-10]|uniref:DMT family transporter n=1 Tax=Sphingobacterium sp. lm-10 TaxID=2944904 RepID=UPI002021A490|nr:DMT family transporter [Sphingobacterium sp. lm-10]MCL7989429.1 DMT family transporter [Sphingobacterium sp. lm-10]